MSALTFGIRGIDALPVRVHYRKTDYQLRLEGVPSSEVYRDMLLDCRATATELTGLPGTSIRGALTFQCDDPNMIKLAYGARSMVGSALGAVMALLEGLGVAPQLTDDLSYYAEVSLTGRLVPTSGAYVVASSLDQCTYHPECYAHPEMGRDCASERKSRVVLAATDAFDHPKTHPDANRRVLAAETVADVVRYLKTGKIKASRVPVPATPSIGPRSTHEVLFPPAILISTGRRGTDTVAARYFNYELISDLRHRLGKLGVEDQHTLNRIASAAWRMPIGQTDPNAHPMVLTAHPTSTEAAVLGAHAVAGSQTVGRLLGTMALAHLGAIVMDDADTRDPKVFQKMIAMQAAGGYPTGLLPCPSWVPAKPRTIIAIVRTPQGFERLKKVFPVAVSDTEAYRDYVPHRIVRSSRRRHGESPED